MKPLQFTQTNRSLYNGNYISCQGRLFFPQNRRFKIPQKDLIDPSVFLVGAFFLVIGSFPPLG
jgi:hypothetical protein